jgi:hypothetical protein
LVDRLTRNGLQLAVFGVAAIGVAVTVVTVKGSTLGSGCLLSARPADRRNAVDRNRASSKTFDSVGGARTI